MRRGRGSGAGRAAAIGPRALTVRPLAYWGREAPSVCVVATRLLASRDARARGVATHLCEVQLHFAPIIALKSGGGHKMYVRCRNLGGK